MGRTAVEPDVHDVAFFAEVSAAAFGAFSPCGQDLCGSMRPPGVGAFFGKQVGNGVDGVVIDQMLVTVFAVEDRDRYAPDTLTGNTPVVAVGDHIMDTCFAPGGNPLHVVGDSVQRFFTETVDRSEPLLGSTVDDGVFTAPAVCILMADIFFAEQTVEAGQIFDDGHVSVKDEHTGKIRACFGGQFTGAVHRADDGQVVSHAGLKVVGAVTGSGMDAAGACF